MTAERLDFGAGIIVDLPEERVRAGTKLYLAGPYGFAEATRPFHEKIVLLVEKMGAVPIDPWVLTDKQIISEVASMPESEEKRHDWKNVNTIIFVNNIKDITEYNGVIYSIYGIDFDNVTSSEIFSEFIIGIQIIGYRGEFRLSSDNSGGTVNLQVENSITQSE